MSPRKMISDVTSITQLKQTDTHTKTPVNPKLNSHSFLVQYLKLYHHQKHDFFHHVVTGMTTLGI